MVNVLKFLGILYWNLCFIGEVWWYNGNPTHICGLVSPLTHGSPGALLGHLFPSSFLFLAPALGPCCSPCWVGPGHGSVRGRHLFCRYPLPLAGAWMWAWERLGWVCTPLTPEGRAWSWLSLLPPGSTTAHSTDSAWSLCPPWPLCQVSPCVEAAVSRGLPSWPPWDGEDWLSPLPSGAWCIGSVASDMENLETMDSSVHPVMGHLWGSAFPHHEYPCAGGSPTLNSK